MAHEADQKAADDRYVLLSALLLMLAVSAAGFGRVYQGTGTSTRLVLVAIVSLALAAILERRHVLLATAASAAALVVMAGLMVFHETTRFALPTLSTLRAAAEAMSLVGRASAAQIAPAAPIRPLLLSGVIAVWTAAFASHALASRGRSPFLALVPPATLLAFSGMVLGDGARPGYVFVFILGALGVLFADALRRVGAWGPVTVWRGRRKLRSGSGTTARGAWRVAATCLGVALFLPWLLPGFNSKGLLSVRSGPAQPVSIDPIVDIRPRLLQRPALQLMAVKSSRPAYWRFLALDTFDGQRWSASNLTANNGFALSAGSLPAAQPDLPCASPDSELSVFIGIPTTCPRGFPDKGPNVFTVQQTFSFGPLAQGWLPAAFDPISVSAPKQVRFDAAAGTLYAPDFTYRGYTYSVTSLEVVPTPAELNAIPNLDGVNTAYFTQLPTGMPPEIAQIAQQWTEGAITPYQKVMAIQQHLLSFAYDLNVKFADSKSDLLYFLNTAHRGFCEQFAGAMAVLLRSLGIPARVAEGFTPGSPDAKSRGVWRVTTQNAHAWVEVLFPHYGWLQFEPTPGRSNPVAFAYDSPPAQSNGRPGPCRGPVNRHGVCLGPGKSGALSRAAARKQGLLAKIAAEARSQFHLGYGATPGPRRSLIDRFRWIGLRASLALILAFAVGVPAWKILRRRAIVRRSASPNQRVLAAYRALLNSASDVGFRRLAHETLVEYRTRLTKTVSFSNGDLDRITGLAQLAAYGASGLTAEDAEAAVASSRQVIRDIRRAVTVRRRALGLFRIERL